MSFPVLICDDSAIGRKMVRRSLPEALTQDVHTASNGVEALECLANHPIQLLMLDLTMPIMDGVEVLEQIKARKIEVFVIVVSGDIQPEMKKRVTQLGALDFIEKPVDKTRLNGVLSNFGLY